MKTLLEKARSKTGIILILILTIGLIAAISLKMSGASDTKRAENKPKEENVVLVDVKELKENESKPKVEVQVVEEVPKVAEPTPAVQETIQTSEAKSTEVPVKSIQEGQPKVKSKPSPPPTPVPQGDVNDGSVEPTYKEADVKPEKAQPKMGDKNNKGQVYIEGFGWVKDEGGGGKGTDVGKSGDQLTGNKVGSMD